MALLAVVVPPGVVTLTVTAPAEPAGLVALTCVELTTVRLVPAIVPNFTAVAPVRLLPVMVTTVPPVVGPVVGEIELATGAAGVGVV
ncbi:hypothetical protein ASE25_11390 [Terrabacter sp. Root85]|nr:hypothetical protein [Terrabacter sp. Root85]KRC90086.1 hypothetical protein ASE25_11390 [Terrabacter sp. Root85]